MPMNEGDIFIHEYGEVDLKDAMVVIGFPSVGLVSSIASNYIVRSMKLERKAAIISKRFPPYTIIHEGIPSPPVRIYSGHRGCEDKGEQCEKLAVITCEFMPQPELIKELSNDILGWCKKKGISTIMTLEGINLGAEGEGKVFGVGTTQRTRAMLETYGVKELKEGMVTGISGLLLSEGERYQMDVICLLGSARTDLPDARGAANLLEVVGDMLPEIKLDPEPLVKEAEQIETEMQKAMESVQQPKKPVEYSNLYG
ncbi:MAG: PAC2 family protein [Methanomassiliicoccales archaeon PtaB.Bin134]|nr:MAG: PAC2 family protein [Methanomassiliicoccales archaeon PtaB.Bin134]